ncbi:hypothetical protein C8Q80DRAFT_1350953 [Daedaleopsis nitida]|nr:hypothetical protein C8Q80DRAFT_1350953 [Daedaleopsis nitida]
MAEYTRRYYSNTQTFQARATSHSHITEPAPTDAPWYMPFTSAIADCATASPFYDCAASDFDAHASFRIDASLASRWDTVGPELLPHRNRSASVFEPRRVVGSATLLVAIAILFFYIGRVRERRIGKSQVPILDSQSVRASPYDVMGAAEGQQPDVQDCAEIGRALHTPVASTAIPALAQEFSEPTRAARIPQQKDRTRFESTTGTNPGGEVYNRPEGGTQARPAGDQLRQAHDGGVRLAGGPWGSAVVDSDVPDDGDDDRQTVVSSAPSTAPPPYQPQY